MDEHRRLTLLRLTLTGALLLTSFTLFQLAKPVYEAGILFRSQRWMAAIGLGALGVALELSLLTATWTSARKIFQWLETGLSLLEHLKKLNILIFIASIGLFSYLVLGKYGHYFQNLSLRMSVFLLFVLVGCIQLKASGIQKGWGELLGVSLLFLAFGYKIATYSSDVSTYPFSLGWSEGSRYYYASLFLSERVYGISIPPTVLHPSRYLMQAVSFLIPNSPLWSHRLWQVILWITTTNASAFLLARRLSINDQLRRWALVAWTFLFLLLGPVYYHLLVPVILVLWLFDRRRFWQSLVVVLLASAWAGISRLNWFPVPGMLAAALYFLEKPSGKQIMWQYLIRPVSWIGLGTMAAFVSQTLYAVWSGNPPEQFTSSFSSDLLWYRLLPNPTYPLGVLPAILLVSLPFFLLIAGLTGRQWRAYHPIRLLGLGAILLILLAGGIVVSTKIGGGSNLHNLDAYLTLLLVVAAYVFFGKFINEKQEDQPAVTLRWSITVGLAFVILLPVYFTLISGGPVTLPNTEETSNSLARLTRFVRAAAEEGGEVLFIDERQLLTFYYIEGVSLVPDYEKVFLMEMTMGGNKAYLSRFYEDLKNHRFEMIVTEPLFTRRKGSAEPFGEENDAWVEHVSEPVLCYYMPHKRLREVRIQLLVPRAEPKGCP